MSLLQDIQSFSNNLNNKYNRSDMSEILDMYCERISKLPQENVAEYVLDADKQRWLDQKDDFGNPINIELNSGHVYTGVMNDEKLFNKFENWFNDTYILDSDLVKFDSIENTIAKHLDSRCEGMVISHLIDNGLNTMKDKDTIQNALFEIDKRHDKNIIDNYNAKLKDEQQHYLIFGRSFEKALQKTCYIIANQHEPLDLAEYISKDLDLRYNNNVCSEVIFDNYDPAETPRKLTIIEPNNKRLVETLSNSLQNAVNYIIDNSRYFDFDESTIDEALNITEAHDYKLEDINEQYEVDDFEPQNINVSKDNGKEL